MKRSAIGYVDYSGGDLNFVSGCTPISAGCEHCYARAIYERFGLDWNPRAHVDRLERLSKANFLFDRNKRGMGTRPLAFVCDTGDIFHPEIGSSFVVSAFEMMEARHDVDWLVLTKRPRMMAEMLYGPPHHYLGGGDHIRNIWLGVTAENQAMAEARIPTLIDNWLGRCWVSVEPMLEDVDLTPWLPRLDWAVVGAESGPERRPFDTSWACALLEQCRDAKVAYFGKQDSGARPGRPLLLHGQVVQEWPK